MINLDFIKVPIKSATKFIDKNSPNILTGLGIGGFVGTVIMAVKETPKAIGLMEAKKTERNFNGEKVKMVDYISVGFKAYWPAIAMGSVSIACFIFSNTINTKRNAALAAAFSLAQDSIKNISEKIEEELGEKKLSEIKDSISKDKVTKHYPLTNEDAVIRTSNGDTLCFDAIAGRYFYSSAEAIRKAENEMNKRMLRDNFISLNEFYLELDLPPIKYGDELGWDVNLEGAADIEFSSHLNNNNQPCLVIDSDICPRWHLYS